MNCRLLTSLVLISACAWSHSALSVYDGFLTGGGNYTAGSVIGQNPAGSGFSAAWEKPGYSSNNLSVQAGGLSYGSLISSGGSLTTSLSSTRAGRLLSSPITSTSIGTFYISFLVSTSSTSASDYRSVEFHKNTGFDDANDRVIQVGVASADMGTNGYGLRLFSNNSFRIPLSSAADTGTHLVVIRLDQSAANNGDTVTAWFDPVSLGGSEPGGSSGTLSGFNMELSRFSAAQFANTAIAADEIRIGTTWAEVTPVPEPSIALIGLLGIGTLTRRKRRAH